MIENIKDSYPKGIGQAYCLYIRRPRPPQYKQLVGANPEPQMIRHRGINSGSSAAAEREDN